MNNGLSEDNTLLRLCGLHKHFGSTHALRGVDLEIGSGEVTVLMGANGAGKSTLVKLVYGVYGMDEGKMYLGGEYYSPRSPHDALRSGVVTVHQHIRDGVIADMTVAENLAIDRWCMGEAGWLFTPRMARRLAKPIAERLDLRLKLDSKVRELSLADKQLVAIARALSHHPRLLILDEPTASLSRTESERLFGLVERLRQEGCAILYISHRLSDIKRLADKVVTLRNGIVAGVFASPVNYGLAVETMLGYAVSEVRHQAAKPREAALEVQNLRLREDSAAINVAIHRGQVTAIIGLVGSGKTEFAECLFGLRQPYSGKILLGGKEYAARSAREAIKQGVFMTPEDRAEQALLPDFCLFENLVLPFTSRFSRWGWLRRRKERKLAREQIAALKIVCDSEEAPIGSLSGGNQQKVVLGRWLCQPCHVLVMDEPFFGVDIGARRDIGAKLRATSAQCATLVLCSDPDEALEIADRLLVFHNWSLNGDHSITQLDRKRLVQQMAYA